MRILVFLLFLAPAALFAQQNANMEAITGALSTGDATALSKYFADNVALSIQDKEQVQPKAKALEIVRDFFGANPPSGFSQLHKGNSRENSDQYCIGNLTAANGKYRVYMYLKNAAGATSIQEIRIEKE